MLRRVRLIFLRKCGKWKLGFIDDKLLTESHGEAREQDDRYQSQMMPTGIYQWFFNSQPSNNLSLTPKS